MLHVLRAKASDCACAEKFCAALRRPFACALSLRGPFAQRARGCAWSGWIGKWKHGRPLDEHTLDEHEIARIGGAALCARAGANGRRRRGRAAVRTESRRVEDRLATSRLFPRETRTENKPSHRATMDSKKEKSRATQPTD
jgi:hypothetical protein